VKQDIKDLSKNKPWVAMLFLTILVFITLSLKGGMYVYYFENYLDKVQLEAFLQNIGFNGLIDNLNSLLTRVGLVGFVLA